MTKKSQVSIELIMVLSVVLIIFTLLIVSINKRYEQYIYERRYLDAKSQAEKFAGTINMIHLSGQGSSTRILMPHSLEDGSPYNISLSAMAVNIEWPGKTTIRHYSTPLITSNISGNFSYDSLINFTSGGIVIE